MKLTAEQAKAILPHLQIAVQAQIERWEAEGQIEAILEREIENMQDGIEYLAVAFDSGSQVTLDDVQTCIGDCITED